MLYMGTHFFGVYWFSWDVDEPRRLLRLRPVQDVQEPLVWLHCLCQFLGVLLPIFLSVLSVYRLQLVVLSVCSHSFLFGQFS